MAPRRFTFPKPSEETQRFAALLEAEALRWPEVRTGKMFGMVSLYRNKTIFALLPATRALDTPNSIMIKRERPAKREGEKWQTIEIPTEADLPTALNHLQDAYNRSK